MDPLLQIAIATGDSKLAHQALESRGNAVLGTASVESPSLDIPVPTGDTKTIMSGWGFMFDGVEKTQGRYSHWRLPLSCRVPCPPGWSVRQTNHHLYKDLVDSLGQVRASIMLHYQDHDSWITVERKYRPCVYQRVHGGGQLYPVIMDSSRNTLWVGTPLEDTTEEYRKQHTEWCKHSRSVYDKEGPQAHTEWESKNPSPVSPYDTARSIAEKKLEELIPGSSGYQEFIFPPSDGSIPNYIAYSLHTTYYHQNGSYADSGSSIVEALDEGEAIKIAEEGLKKSSFGFHIKMALSKDGKSVWEGEAGKKRPASSMVDAFYGFEPWEHPKYRR